MSASSSSASAATATSTTTPAQSSALAEGAALFTDEHLRHFVEHGYCVVENVLISEEIDALQLGMRRHFRRTTGVDILRLKSDEMHKLPRSHGHLNFFYHPAKIEALCNERVFGVMSALWRQTFASGTVAGFEHGHGAFDPTQAFAYCDRGALRYPDSFFNGAAKGGLPLHCDCNPWQMHSDGGKWRPVQMSLALSDHVDESTGGLGVADGWHTRIEEYCSRVLKNGTLRRGGHEKLPTSQFNILQEAAHPEIHRSKRYVRQPIGSLVLWDNRLPHFVSSVLTTDQPRQVLFHTFLPNVAVNEVYAQRQLSQMMANRLPPDFVTPKKAEEPADADKTFIKQMTPFQKRLFGLEPWE